MERNRLVVRVHQLQVTRLMAGHSVERSVAVLELRIFSYDGNCVVVAVVLTRSLLPSVKASLALNLLRSTAVFPGLHSAPPIHLPDLINEFRFAHAAPACGYGEPQALVVCHLRHRFLSPSVGRSGRRRF